MTFVQLHLEGPTKKKIQLKFILLDGAIVATGNIDDFFFQLQKISNF